MQSKVLIFSERRMGGMSLEAPHDVRPGFAMEVELMMPRERDGGENYEAEGGREEREDNEDKELLREEVDEGGAGEHEV